MSKIEEWTSGDECTCQNACYTCEDCEHYLESPDVDSVGICRFGKIRATRDNCICDDWQCKECLAVRND